MALSLDGTTGISTDGGTTLIDDATVGGNLSFADNGKAIFGVGSDLQIYHDGSNSYITDAGTGNLNIQGNNLLLEDPNGVNFLGGNGSTGAVTVYHAGAARLATTATGVDVTGTVTADGLTVGDSHLIGNDSFDNLAIVTSSTESLVLAPNGSTFIKRGGTSLTSTGTNTAFFDGSTGDVSFYEDTGTTAKFYWDSSAESLGIGNTVPASKLDIGLTSDLAAVLASFRADGFTTRLEHTGVGSHLYTGGSSAYLALGTNSIDRLTITSAGNVGIGETSPSGKLHVKTSSNEAAIIVQGDTGATLASGTGSTLAFRGNNNAGNPWEIYRENTSSGDLVISENVSGTRSNYMRIKLGTGNVGIGVSSPAAQLDIGSGSTSTLRLSNSDTILSLDQITGEISFSQSDSTASGTGITGRIGMRSSVRPDSGTYFGNSADMGFFVSGGASGSASDNAPYEALTIRANGNVGIGETSPAQKLHISNASTSYALAETTGTGTSSGFVMKAGASANYTLFTTQGVNQFAIYDNTAGVQRLTLDSSGTFSLRSAPAGNALQFGTTSGGFYSEGTRIGLESGKLAIKVGSTTTDSMVITNTGVGIGTSSPAAKLQVGAAGAVYANLSPSLVVISDTSASGSAETTLGIYQSAGFVSSAVGLVAGVTGGTAPYFAIKTRPTAGGDSVERARIDSSGHLIVPNGITLGTAVGTYAAANTLDDYEEGTWTPNPKGSVSAGTYSISARYGNYVKVGRQVTVTGVMAVTSFTGTGDFIIDGLPFGAQGDETTVAPQFNTNPFGNLLAGSSQIIGLIGNQSPTSIIFRACDTDTTNGVFKQLTCGSSTIEYLRISATYITP